MEKIKIKKKYIYGTIIALIGKYKIIDKSAAIGNVKNHIKTIFHNPLLTGV